MTDISKFYPHIISVFYLLCRHETMYEIIPCSESVFTDLYVSNYIEEGMILNIEHPEKTLDV